MRTLLAAWTSLVMVGGLAAAEVQPGQTLDQSSWQSAEGLLPPEVLRHYKDGEYSNKVLSWPQDKFNWPTDFKAATTANEGKFTVSEKGTVLDKATNAQPAYVMGHPFPTIDPSDPGAATKILWNHFYRTWYFGNLIAESQLNWTSPTALERRSDVVVYFGYYDGLPKPEMADDNPENFLYRQLSLVVGPADLHGTAALTWRYRDPDKRDSTWAYVPALRRVRATSPANRSDGFLGSDVSQDDGPFFDGKPEDFTWTLKGEQDQLRLVEETNMSGKGTVRWTDKGWDTDWPDIPYVGYMDPNWKGVAWAPTGAAALAKRRFWVIEGTPRDKYYLYGKLELWVDKTTFQGAWSRKFGWKGELLAIHQVMGWNPLPFTRPDGKVDYLQGGNQAFQTVENVKMNRATVAGIKSSPGSRFVGRFKIDESVFAMDRLSQTGK